MAEGWDDILYKHLQNQLKINCCLRFQYKCKDIFAVASCRECYGRFEFYTPNESESDEVIIVIKKLKEVDETLHVNSFKRKIKGSARDAMKEKLLLQKPLSVYDDIVNLNNTTKHPLVPSIQTLRKIRTENNDLKSKGCDEYARLRSLNHSIKNFGLIKYLLQAPNYVNMFWTDEQEKIVRETKETIFLIDATGKIVKSPIMSESKNYEIVPQMQKPVFLYLMMLRNPTSEMTVPVNQMLTNSHTADTIQKWLSEFKLKTDKNPDEVRVDCSSALLSAISNTYNKCGTKKYLVDCYESLSQNKLLVTTIIRLDKSHVVQIFSKWKVWITSKCGKIVKYFFIKVLKQLIKESDFDVLKKVTEHIVRIMITKNENSNVIVSLNFLNDYINEQCDSDEKIDENFDEEEEETFLENDELVNDETWIKSLYDKVAASTLTETLKDTPSKKINPFYLPEFRSDLIRIMNLVPLWTNIMRSLVKYQFDLTCTTSSLESKFNNIKHTIFHNYNLPTSSDKFIQIYANHVKAEVIKFNDATEAKTIKVKLPQKRKKEEKHQKKSELKSNIHI